MQWIGLFTDEQVAAGLQDADYLLCRRLRDGVNEMLQHRKCEEYIDCRGLYWKPRQRRHVDECKSRKQARGFSHEMCFAFDADDPIGKFRQHDAHAAVTRPDVTRHTRKTGASGSAEQGSHVGLLEIRSCGKGGVADVDDVLLLPDGAMVRSSQGRFTIHCLAASSAPAGKCLISADTKCDARCSATLPKGESVTTATFLMCL